MERKLDSFPNRPLSRRDLQQFNEQDNLEVLAAEGAMPSPAAHTVALETENWYYVLGYESGQGWEILERLERSTPDGREKIQSMFDEWVEGDSVRTDRPF